MNKKANEWKDTEAPLAYAFQWVATPTYPYLYGKDTKIFQRTNFNTPLAKRIRANRHCYIPATPLDAKRSRS